jgi:hypothetical protein
VRGKFCRQNLHGDISAKSRIAGTPNLAHAARADLGNDGVLSDRCLGENGYAHIIGSMIHFH